MDSRYKIILSSNNVYKEVDLSPEAKEVKVGTGVECDVRLRRELFFGQIELSFVKTGSQWSVNCSDGLYITVGDVRKLMTKKLQHGDTLEVKYQDSDIQLFTLSFTLDFDYENKKYDTEIDISGFEHISIGGGNGANIAISDPIIGSDYLTIKKSNDRIILFDNNAKYGIYVNGSRINKQKEIKDFDFFSIANYSFYYKNGKLYTELKDNIKCNSLTTRKLDLQTTHFEYPDFIRNTRVEYCIPESEIEIKQPLPKPQKSKKNLVFSLIPSIVMLGLMVVMRGIIGGGGTFVIYSVCSMGIGIVMSVVTYFYDGKEYKKEAEKREKEYREYVSKKEQEVISARENELRIRNQIYESLSNSINEVLNYGKRIFEKSSRDKDYLDIYLGTGTVEANVPVKYTKQDFIDTDDAISQLPATIEEKYHYIENAPIISRFNSSNGVGIVGNKSVLYDILKNITLDLAIRHFYREVKMYYMFNEFDFKIMQWVKWLRHVYNDEIGIRNFMCDDESRKILLENLYAVLSAREASKKENESLVFDTNYVIFVLDSSTIRKHPVSRYIEECNKYGFTFVFFEEYEEFIPKGCTEIIRLNNDHASGVILESANGDLQTTFTYTQVPNSQAETVALKLGSVSVEEVSLESELTKSISMYEMLDIFSVEDLDLKERWNTSQVFKSMAAPLGVKTKNELVYLDISDKSNAHGPHGLVAGTTGSGKSEILQTYVLSMATLYHPYDVGFVIIDFKGGGMANQFKDLPHIMGAITNIDGREINRSLLSIKAELVKRQSYFAEAGVNHINDYIKLFKKNAVKQPLPHLIIIVDEFAELKAEFPDFMKELISTARIGRTLGVHLILATQKPAGVVDAQIWSNSKFKLCLKVQTKEDSNEVIKTPLAAEIVEPGRAYFQVGNNEIFELFQSAYSGVKVADDGDDKTRVFSIYALNNWGKKTLIYTNKKKSASEDAKNQLQTIVDYVNAYCRTSNITQLNGICLPSLPDVVKKDALAEFNKSSSQNIVVPVGFYDDPERQDQGNYCLDLSENNTFIIGSAMTGKTTLLQTILLQLMNYYTPAEVNVYIIDCGNMTLKSFESSNIVGGVAFPAEEDEIINLFKMLFRIINERKKVLSEKGLGTHNAYIEAGYTDMPQVILMIDNMAAFREYYDNLSDDFLALSREGTSLGISIIATATQTNAMNYKALSNYGTRIALVCNDTNEYMNLFDRCRLEPKDTAGRGLCVIDKRILEFQTALCVEGDKEYIRIDNIKKAINDANANYAGLKAVPIPTVPNIVKKSVVFAENPMLYTQPYQIPIGIDFASVQYVSIDLTSIGYFAITGKAKSGKTNFIKNIVETIQENIFDNLTRAYVFDDPYMSLDFCKDYGFVEQYELDESSVDSVVSSILEEMRRRAALIRENKNLSPADVIKDEPLILMIIENKRIIEYITKNTDLLTQFKELLEGILDVKMCVIFSDIENLNVGFNTPEVYKVIKNNKKVFVFEDVSEIKFVDVSVKQQKENAKPLQKGDAYMCFQNNMQRIRTIYVDQ